MTLGNISLGPCISNIILLAGLVVQNWDFSLDILWGLVKTFVTGPGATRTIQFFFDSSSAAKLISRFTGVILEELITAVPNSGCTPSSSKEDC